MKGADDRAKKLLAGAREAAVRDNQAAAKHQPSDVPGACASHPSRSADVRIAGVSANTVPPEPIENNVWVIGDEHEVLVIDASHDVMPIRATIDGRRVTQILENQAVYIGRRSVMTKLAAAVSEDVGGRELYLAYARDDRSTMWVRLHDEGRVAKALRVLVGFDWLHARYFGENEQHDFHIS